MNPDKKIWIVGSSLVHWAELRARKEGGNGCMLTSPKVQWQGQRGMKWNHLLPKVKSMLAVTAPPSMLFVHLGGNDLSSIPLRKLTEIAKYDLTALAGMCPQTVLVWSDVLPRIHYRGAHADNKMEKTRKTFNSSMRAFIKKENGKAIRHPKIQWYFPELFREDGVHLNDKGNDAFLGTFHNSIRCFENDPGRREFPITQ